MSTRQLGVFLRRTRILPARNEYLFFTMEAHGIKGKDRIIAPMLPGNDETNTLQGTDSTNFIFNIGSQQVGLQISGFLLPVTASVHLPAALPNPGVDVFLPSLLTARQDVSGRAMRKALLDFWAAQSGQTSIFNDFRLGITELDDAGSGDITIDGAEYWFIEGMMREPDIRHVAGETDQYLYSFPFTVGDT